MYQKVVVVGNLGSDAQLQYTETGVPVAKFNVAVNKKWTGADGERHEKTTWFRVSAWRKLAEACNQYLGKGMLVLVEGELEGDKDSGGPRVWVDSNGKHRAAYELTARNVLFLEKKRDSGEEVPF